MQYQQLGRTGLKVSRLSLGTWITFVHQLGERDACDLIRFAFDSGINLFDCAEQYANGEAERMLGRALRTLPASRDSYCLSSKVYWGGDGPTQFGLSRKHIFDACHASLKRLDTDYLDLFSCHRPDPDTPIYETASAMNDLVRQGKIRYWGVSRWCDKDIRASIRLAKKHNMHAPVAEQPEYNLLMRRSVELNLSKVVKKFGLGLTSTSPLAYGTLTGKHMAGFAKGSRFYLREFESLRERLPPDQDTRTAIQALLAAALECGCTPAQLAVAWCLRNPRVSAVLLGVSSREQLAENLGALEVLDSADAAVFDQIDNATRISRKARLRYWARQTASPIIAGAKRIRQVLTP